MFQNVEPERSELKSIHKNRAHSFLALHVDN
jgi:hypothetical protein